jgi:hypoxanthine-DNA glycosylase
MTTSIASKGLPPIATPDARVLILGTMPGNESLRQQQYYAHPRNAFWPIMGRLVAAGPELPYEERLEVLNQHGIALRDVLHRCWREGSLDSTIADGEPNDFATFLDEHPKVHAIMFNGNKAQDLFNRHVWPGLYDRLKRSHRVRMPSISPANTRLSFEDKMNAWGSWLNIYLMD